MRKELEEILIKHNSFLQGPNNPKDLIEDLLRWKDPNYNKKWCEHIKWSNEDNNWILHFSLVSDMWNCCPICGKERPHETP